MRIDIRLRAFVLVAFGIGLGIAVCQQSMLAPAWATLARTGGAPKIRARQVTPDKRGTLTSRVGEGRSSTTHGQTAPPPVLGSWRWLGTAPSGFVRQGMQEAQVALTLHQGHLWCFVSTGRHRYTADARYISTQHQLQLTIFTAQGRVRVQAMMLKGNQCLIGTWYDARGNDGGFVLVRINAAPSHRTARQ